MAGTNSSSTHLVLQQVLELDHLSLSLLVTTQFKVFTSLQCNLLTELTLRTLQTQHNLLRRLCLLMMNRSCLSTISFLFAFIPSLSLSKGSFLCSLVLRHFMKGMFAALLSIAKGFTGLGYVHHCCGCLL